MISAIPSIHIRTLLERGHSSFRPKFFDDRSIANGRVANFNSLGWQADGKWKIVFLNSPGWAGC